MSDQDAVQPSEIPPPDAPVRLSTLIRALAARKEGDPTVGEILTMFGDRAFGAGMLLFAAPNALPMPPGTSSILGAPLLFITAQMMIGRHVVWFPAFINDRRMPLDRMRPILEKIDSYLLRAEKVLRPRLLFLTSKVQERLIGTACFILSIILFLPIPLGNMPPATAMSLFALGLAERDGVMVLAGWAVTIFSIGILVLIAGALWAAAVAFFTTLVAWF